MKKTETQTEPLFPVVDLTPEEVERDFQGSIEMFVQGVARRSRRTYQRLCKIGVLPAVKTKEGFRIKTDVVVSVLKEENRKAELDIPFRRKLIERLVPTYKNVRDL